MYKALVRFADLQDGGHIYEAGSEFPRLGFVVSQERIEELAGSDNRMGYPLIKLEKPDAPSKAVEAPVKAAEPEPDKIPTRRRKAGNKAVSER